MQIILKHGTYGVWVYIQITSHTPEKNHESVQLVKSLIPALALASICFSCKLWNISASQNMDGIVGPLKRIVFVQHETEFLQPVSRHVLTGYYHMNGLCPVCRTLLPLVELGLHLQGFVLGCLI